MGQGSRYRSSLLDGLVAFWKLNEAITGGRDDALDALGVATLTAEAGAAEPTSVAGRIGLARGFAQASAQFFSRSNADIGEAGLSPGLTDCTFSAWFNATSFPDNYTSLGGTWLTTDDNREWAFMRVLGNFGLVISEDGTWNTNLFALDTLPSTGAWHHAVGWVDTTDNKARFQLDGGSVITATTAVTAIKQGTSPFYLGCTSEDPDVCWNGALDAVGVWNRKLTANEREALYKGGTGREYPF